MNITTIVKPLKLFLKAVSDLEDDEQGLDKTYILYQLDLINQEDNSNTLWKELSKLVEVWDNTKLTGLKEEINIKYKTQIDKILNSNKNEIDTKDKADFNECRAHLDAFLKYYKNSWKPWYENSVIDKKDAEFINNSETTKTAVALAFKYLNHYKAKYIYKSKYFSNILTFAKQPQLLKENNNEALQNFIKSWKSFKTYSNYKNFNELKDNARALLKKEPNEFAEKVVKTLAWMKTDNKAIWLDKSNKEQQ